MTIQAPNQRTRRPQARRWRRTTNREIASLVLLLAMPVATLFRSGQSLDFRWVLGYWACVCGLTYLLYARDKRKAEAGEWRISEATLHLAELAGGWPAAYVAQRELRHKISKLKYQLTFWGIVLLHEFVAFDSLLAWQFTRSAAELVRGAIAVG